MSVSVLFLIKAWLIGIIIAAPVGPIGILCIRKTLEFGFWGTFSVALGAAFADGIYGTIAAMGLSAISQFLLEKTMIIKIFGGVFLLLLAYKELRSSPFSRSVTAKNGASLQLTFEVFLLTLSNPITILAFIGVFASLTECPTNIIESASMVLGVILGSMTWWFILGYIITKITRRMAL